MKEEYLFSHQHYRIFLYSADFLLMSCAFRLQNSTGLNASLVFVAEGYLSLGDTGRDERTPGRDERKPGSERVSNEVVGVLAMCACGTDASECATSGVSVLFNASDCTMTLSAQGR